MIDRIHPSGSPPIGLLVLSSLVVGLSCGKGGSAQQVPTRDPSFRDGYLVECLQTCDDGNPCTTDLCNYKTGTCYTELAADGIACDDGNPCTLGDACLAGTCRGTDKDCSSPPDQCHEAGYCLPASGSCSYPISTDGKTCNDNNACTSGEYCQQGKCSGVALQCRPPAACGIEDGICKQNGAVAFPSPLWGLALDGGIDAIYLPGIAFSPSGAIFLTGAFKGTLDLGSGPVASVGDDDVFIARLNPEDGKASWLRPYGDRFGQRGLAVAANGEVVLAAGVFLGTVDFGLIDGAPTTYNNTGSSPMGYLVAQNEKDGQPLWVQPFDLLQTGSVLATAMMRVAADPTDSSFVICGLANKAVNGLGAPMPAMGKADILVAKVDGLTKNVRWARQIGSSGDDECHGLAVDSLGNIIMTGQYSGGTGKLDFGSGYVLPAASTVQQVSGFVAKLDKQGSTLWVNRIVPKANGAKVGPEAIVTDGQSLWIGGSFQRGAGFGETSLTPLDSTSSSLDSAFVANYTADGSLLWAKNWGTRARVLALSLTPTGELLVEGDYASNMKLDSGDLQDSLSGLTQAFFARMKASTGVVTAARGYARGTADQSKSFFFAMASAPSQLASLPSASYLLGSFEVSFPLGAPVAALDVGTASGSRIVLAKIAP